MENDTDIGAFAGGAAIKSALTLLYDSRPVMVVKKAAARSAMQQA